MSQIPSPAAIDQPRVLSKGLAIASLVCAIVSMCIPGLGLVAIVLGIIALVKAISRPQTHGGLVLAIIAIVVGVVSIPVSFVGLGIFLPAAQKARETARQLKSSTQLKAIDRALLIYAEDNKGWLPEAGADWQARLRNYNVSAGQFVSPRDSAATAADSYVYIPGHHVDVNNLNLNTVLVYENPKYVPRGVVNVGYIDGRVDPVPQSLLQQILDTSPKPHP